MKLFKKKEPKAVEIKEHPLVCPICRNNLFWTRKVQLNRSLTTLFNLDWADRSATCFICSNCTHIHWFLG